MYTNEVPDAVETFCVKDATIDPIPSLKYDSCLRHALFHSETATARCPTPADVKGAVGASANDIDVAIAMYMTAFLDPATRS